MRATPSPSPTASGAERREPASERAREILGWLRAASDEIRGLVEDLVRLESPSDEPDSQGPVLDRMAAELAALGLRSRRFAGRVSGGYLVARRRRRRGHPFQLLIGHCDTVWPRGTLATMPITVADGRLTGPGSYDMKGGLATMVWALKALAALRLEPPVDPMVMVNSDEEIGSLDSVRPISRLAPLADRAFILEPAGGRSGKLKTARKGVCRYELRLLGRAAHSGTEPDRGASAILELAHVVQSLFALNDARRGITVNVGTISGGLRPNVVAPESSAVVDVRMLDRDQADEIDRAIRSLVPLDPRVRIHVEGGLEALPMERTERNRVLWKMARRAGRELGLEIGEMLAGGASDGNTTSLYTSTLDGLGPVGGGAHAAHEFILLDSLAERAALLALLLLAAPLRAADPGASSP